MKKKLYSIEGMEEKSIVYETKRQRDILDVLDEMLEGVDTFGWEYTFEDDSFFIEYKDSSTYSADFFEECGKYKKKGIKRIIYTNVHDTMVYGEYNVNEFGDVY